MPTQFDNYCEMSAFHAYLRKIILDYSKANRRPGTKSAKPNALRYVRSSQNFHFGTFDDAKPRVGDVKADKGRTTTGLCQYRKSEELCNYSGKLCNGFELR